MPGLYSARHADFGGRGVDAAHRVGGGGVDRPFDPSWYRLQRRLIADGIDPITVRAVFNDPRMESFRGLAFALDPAPSTTSLYRGFLRPTAWRARAVAAWRMRGAAPGRAALRGPGRRGRRHHARRIAVRPQHRPPPRAAAAREAGDGERSRNVSWNDRSAHGRRAGPPPRRGRGAGPVTGEPISSARSTPKSSRPSASRARNGIDPLAITGPSAGAFGLTQFLPSSYLRFAVDRRCGDGVVSLYDPDDAIASTANYLRGNGWRPGISYTDQRRVIWTYNHSDAYIDTVLRLADVLGERRGAPSERSSRTPAAYSLDLGDQLVGRAQREQHELGAAGVRRPRTRSTISSAEPTAQRPFIASTGILNAAAASWRTASARPRSSVT